MTTPVSKALQATSQLFGHLEKWILVLLISLLAFFSVLQIVLRNFFATGLVWSDELLRHGVLWVSFLGATRATAENKHIRIDLLPRLLSDRGRFAVGLACSFFSCLVCLVLFWASWNFVKDERLFAGTAFASIPYWCLEVIFPFSFALMALRFGFGFITGLIRGPDGIEP
ncbi:MAG: TRAP transporter small permease [Deltaproteobacteria bacterium]|nr:MAG: TRAP transporter small permease [Deltaproteobacteria bacterium]